MSTVSTASTAAASVAASNTALQQAAQSIISGSTGNSSMDVNSLVTALVNAKTAGQTAALTTQQTTDNTQISAYGALSSALSALQAGLASLSDGTTVNQFTATASGTGLTASAASGATSGTYSIDVKQTAASQVLTSNAYGATDTLGSGTLTLSVNGQSTSITIGDSNNTVAGIAAAINSASNNPGVSATVVNGSDGAHLVLHSTVSGKSGGITVGVNETDSGGKLSTLAVSTTAGTAPSVTTATGSDGKTTTTVNSGASSIGTNSNWTQTTGAQDSYFTIDGTAVTSGSNTVTTALSGVTLNLTSAAIAASPQTLTIAQDTTGQTTTINNFVNLYNTLVTTMSTLTSYSSGSSSQGALLGDSTLNLVRNSLSQIAASGIGSGSNSASLATLGITLQADGTLSVDSSTLSNALSSNQAAVAKVFGSTGGIAKQMNTKITSLLSSSGPITTRTNALNDDLTNITAKQKTLTDYQSQLTDMYNAQFTALNTLMSTMNNNSQYLTQLFGGTNSAGAMATNK